MDKRRNIMVVLLAWRDGAESILLTPHGGIPVYGRADLPPPEEFLSLLAPAMCGSPVIDSRVVGVIDTVSSEYSVVSGRVTNPHATSSDDPMGWRPVSHILYRGIFTDIIVAFARSGVERYRMTETVGRGWVLSFPPPEVKGETSSERKSSQGLSASTPQSVSSGHGQGDSAAPGALSEAEVECGDSDGEAVPSPTDAGAGTT
jgi:hypothetical protein